MALYKLIVVAGDENRTGEYQNVVNSIEKAEKVAHELLAEYEENYPDAYVACYDYDEYIKLPDNDYKCWKRDADGVEGWETMVVGRFGRVGFLSR